MRYCHTVFHRGYTILHFTNNVQEFQFLCNFANTCCFLVVFCLFVCLFLIVPIIMGVMWHLTVILICISLIISDIEHLFICLLTICISLEKGLFKSSAHS